MSQDEFDRRIAALLRQVAVLRQVKSGRLRMRTIEVKAYRVPEHSVRAHTRMIAARAVRS